MNNRPNIAVFPKAFMNALCKTGEMSVEEWIILASKLPVDGLEFYCGFRELTDFKSASNFRKLVEERNLCIPMFCCSPDFTHPDEGFRREQVEKEINWIEMTAQLGGEYCRVLSGQRRPGLSEKNGLRFATECIESCLPKAKELGITLIIENHYKDDFWIYPEFAQKMGSFHQLVQSINDSNFGVNYDPSNAFLAGDDPIELLDSILDRVVTMHASDRYLSEGTLEDLRREENVEGYASRLRHGEIGKGLNDYDAIFSRLAGRNFSGWISVEDGVDGMEQLARSVDFLRRKISEHWK
jgi:sugar phosphate isomerase/epimerase